MGLETTKKKIYEKYGTILKKEKEVIFSDKNYTYYIQEGSEGWDYSFFKKNENINTENVLDYDALDGGVLDYKKNQETEEHIIVLDVLSSGEDYYKNIDKPKQQKKQRKMGQPKI